MKREQKEILKLLEDDQPRTADEIADELFKDVARIVQLTETLAGRRYLNIKSDEAGRLKLTVTGRGKRFIGKFPGFQIS